MTDKPAQPLAVSPLLMQPHSDAWEPAGPAPERITAGQPVALAIEAFVTADGRTSMGYWTCKPGRWRVQYDEDEYCRIISGRGVIHGPDGAQLAIAAGAEVVIPAGFVGEWEVIETMTKSYVAVLP